MKETCVSNRIEPRHFLTLTEGLELLPQLGRMVLWEGAQDVVFRGFERAQSIENPTREDHIRKELLKSISDGINDRHDAHRCFIFTIGHNQLNKIIGPPGAELQSVSSSAAIIDRIGSGGTRY
jgi:hypothetical protein